MLKKATMIANVSLATIKPACIVYSSPVPSTPPSLSPPQ